jgi:hypothetical protein
VPIASNHNFFSATSLQRTVNDFLALTISRCVLVDATAPPANAAAALTAFAAGDVTAGAALEDGLATAAAAAGVFFCFGSEI